MSGTFGPFGPSGGPVSVGLFTGPPGAGKSTLVDRLIAKYRGLGQQVAIRAIDPSRPFSGGAVLGGEQRDIGPVVGEVHAQRCARTHDVVGRGRHSLPEAQLGLGVGREQRDDALEEGHRRLR